MTNIINIESLTELFGKFGNDSNIVEIVTRGKNQRIKAIQKVSLSELGEKQGARQLEEVFSAINLNNKVNMNNSNLLSSITKTNQLGLVLNAANLCATAAGFAIMYKKLDKMSTKINEVLSTVKKGQDIYANYEFKKILSSHSDMLDHRKTQRNYSEKQMRELVDGEYSVLSMLIEAFSKEVTEDTETLMYSIVSLASMLSVSITYFDEEYYYNTKQTHCDGDIWHSSHDGWTKLYDDLCSEGFIQVIQDYLVFHSELSLHESDVYCVNVLDTFKQAKQAIEDNQYLLMKLDNRDDLADLKEFSNANLRTELEEALQDYGLEENGDVTHSVNEAMRQVGIA